MDNKQSFKEFEQTAKALGYDNLKLQAFMEIFDKTGSVYSYRMSGFSPQANISDSMFNFDVSKHPGVEVVDLR